MEGRQDAIAIVSLIKKSDSNERAPYNVWEEGGFRLEVINKPFQEWTGIKLFVLETWDKPVFKLLENLSRREGTNPHEQGFFDSDSTAHESAESLSD